MRAKAESLLHVREALENIVHDSAMKRNRWGLWERARQALEFLDNPAHAPVYIVLGEPGPHQEFIEVENAAGEGVGIAPGQEPYTGHPGMWRLGPLWPFPPEPGPTSVPEPEATPGPSASTDEAPESPTPVSAAPVTELTATDGHELKITPTGEADAVCTCGGWRLLRMSTGGHSPQRHQEIEDAFRQHLNTVVQVSPPEPSA